ncbi:glycosyltransferase [Elizabethkingia anophelis]|uniref:glycosyltransferase n=1 Tax=Elizabethkingia anophelis TaxID=1117645 RepID=UPI0012B34B06|nr:glycosyltransferase [Elizabethkingia anophelis]QGN22151.1 glycosyltransferase [Elizabethkingia anophelis]QNV08803.1 glycosyltransferase [Elizabethkingia anophelis]UTF90558.1 glycosyltransferase [Elizabethkingia anophelis]UTG01429.1 glycosyltransferase [Elizabethkingia anophelis]UTG05179.1 glycosyltransferase [Elizabethkingia anophelis]
MKLLVITPLVPYPLNEGGKISQFAFAEKLQNEVDLYYIVKATDKATLRYCEEFKKMLPNAQVKIIDYSSQQQKRSWLRIFVDKFYKIKQVFEKKYSNNKFNDYNREINFFSEINRTEIDEIISYIDEVVPDIIQVEHTGYINLVEALSKVVKTIFVHHEIQYARLESFKAPESNYEVYKYNLVKDAELALLSKYDAIFTFSDADTKRLENNMNGVTKLFTSPFPILDTYFSEVLKDTFDIEKIVFIGPEGHQPNFDAVIWYLENIAEAVFNTTGLKTHVAGIWSEESIKKYSRPFLIFDGFVEDMLEHNRNSLVIVPLRLGSGIRTKILYSLAQSLPIVSTSIGCEGLGVRDKEHLLICDSVEEFKDGIVDIVRNKHMAYEIACNGYNYVKNNFSQDVLIARRISIYEQLISK